MKSSCFAHAMKNLSLKVLVLDIDSFSETEHFIASGHYYYYYYFYLKENVILFSLYILPFLTIAGALATTIKKTLSSTQLASL